MRLKIIGPTVLGFLVILLTVELAHGGTVQENATSITGYIERYGDNYSPPPENENKHLGGNILVGQLWYAIKSYYQYRGFLSFDTSGIPDDATIENARLYLAIYSLSTVDNDFDMYFYAGKDQWTGAGDLDWGDCLDNQGIFFNTSGKSEDTYYSQTVAPNAINKTGNTQFRLTSSREEALIEPKPELPEIPVEEWIIIYPYSDPVYKPYLEITYSEAPPEQPPPWTPPPEQPPPEQPPPQPPPVQPPCRNRPFLPPPTPDDTRTPDWLWLLLLIALCILESEIMKKDEWGRTPRNTDRGSAPGSWTFIWSPKWSIAMLVLAAFGILEIYDLFGISTALWIYTAFFGLAGIAFIMEHTKPRLPPAYIDLGKDRERGKLLVGGIIMGVIWFLLTGLLSQWLGIKYDGKPTPIELPPMSLGVGILFIGLLAPLIEEQFFRQTLAPTLTEKLGIFSGIIISGVMFGFAHYVFGGSIALAISATGFGIMIAYSVLRNQGAIFADSAHITYNLLVLIVNYLAWGV